ncbi:conserved hypothetical protein [Trichinella spiralis]|uniref:hypothetical protein n=1 Tax=Trichinella spiralis TaxID=6334 RepID=UPI0001EFE93B|nr:conserved hypothetical protein [Trichinella spiralis]
MARYNTIQYTTIIQIKVNCTKKELNRELTMCRKDWLSKVHLLRNLVRYSTEKLLHCTHTKIIFNSKCCSPSNALFFICKSLALTNPDVTCDSTFLLNPAHRSAIRAVRKR